MLHWLGGERTARERHMPQTLRSAIGAASNEAVNEIALKWLHELTFEAVRGSRVYIVTGTIIAEPLETSALMSARVRAIRHPLPEMHVHDQIADLYACLRQTIGLDSDRTVLRHAIDMLRRVVDAASAGKRIIISNETLGYQQSVYDDHLPFPSVSNLLD